MHIDQHRLISYYLGQSSEEEKEIIHQWVESDDANREIFIRERIRFDASILVDESERRFGKRIYLQLWLRWSLRIAASLLLLFGSFYLYDNYRIDQLNQSFHSVSVPAGNRTNIQLPDGTSVWLNAGTTIRYPIAFSKKCREVALDGEGYFEVTKDKKPFIVKTNKYNVEVLGTTFTVEAYAGKPDFRTMLYDGKVKLYNTQHPEAVYLSPGETAQLVGDVLRVSPTSDVNSFRWKDGLIYIEDKSFGDIMKLFEKFYDVQIVINNKKVDRLGYRGKLRISDGIDHALRVLQNDFPFVYKRDEDRHIIYIN